MELQRCHPLAHSTYTEEVGDTLPKGELCSRWYAMSCQEGCGEWPHGVPREEAGGVLCSWHVGGWHVGTLCPKRPQQPWRTWCPCQQGQSEGGGQGRELLEELSPPCMLPWPWDADSHVAGAKGQHSSRLDCWVCNCESTDPLPDLQASKSAHRGGLCVCMCPDSEICGAVHVSAWDLLFGEQTFYIQSSGCPFLMIQFFHTATRWGITCSISTCGNCSKWKCGTMQGGPCTLCVKMSFAPRERNSEIVKRQAYTGCWHTSRPPC